jgi:hypothetical protein
VKVPVDKTQWSVLHPLRSLTGHVSLEGLGTDPANLQHFQLLDLLNQLYVFFIIVKGTVSQD